MLSSNLRHLEFSSDLMLNQKKVKQILAKLKEKDLSELLKGSTKIILFRLLGFAVSYILIFLITRNLGAEAMGTYSLVTTILLMGSIIGTYGFDTTITRFVAEFLSKGQWKPAKEIYYRIIKLLVPLNIIISFLIFLGAPFIANYIFNDPDITTHIRIIALVFIPFVLHKINIQALRAFKKVVSFAFYQNVSLFLFAALFLGVAILFFSADDQTPIWAYAFGAILTAVLSQISIGKAIKKERIDGEGEVKQVSNATLWSISGALMLGTSMVQITNWSDTFILGIMDSTENVGIYNVALRIANLTSLSLLAFTSMSAPKFAAFYSNNDMKGLKKITSHTTKLIFWTSIPFLIIILFFPSFIMGIFGEEFKEGRLALIFIAIGQFVNAISGSVGTLLKMTGKQVFFRNVMTVTMVLSIGLNILLIPKYGINGVAFATMLTTILKNLCFVFYIKHHFNIMTLYIPFISKLK